MRIFDVKILSYDENVDSYAVQYCIENKPGVVRRSKTTYSNDKLSRNEKHKDLITQMVQNAVKRFNFKFINGV